MRKGSDVAVKARVWLLTFLLILVVAVGALISGKICTTVLFLSLIIMVMLPDNFPGKIVISISKTCLDQGFQLLNGCGNNVAAADGTGDDELHGAAAALFVGEGIGVELVRGIFCLCGKTELFQYGKQGTAVRFLA